jgi:hypothetical protein
MFGKASYCGAVTDQVSKTSVNKRSINTQSFDNYKIANKGIYKEELKKKFAHKRYSADKAQSTKTSLHERRYVLKHQNDLPNHLKSIFDHKEKHVAGHF